MDHNELQNLLKLSQFTKPHILKKITQLLVSVSVISLFLSNDTVFSLIHSLNVYFSTFPVKLFSHTIDKNCIFLLCNGLLVFVTKYSGLSSSCSSSRIGRSSYRSFKDYNDDIPHSVSESEMPVLKKSVLAESTAEDLKRPAVEEEIEKEYVIEEAEEREPEQPNVEDEEGGGESGVSSVTKQGGERESLIEEDGQIVVETVDNEYLMQEEEEEDDDDGNDDDVEEGNGLLSTEELNKKFDEFIRKMKEEIRIEGQQQQLAVMVN